MPILILVELRSSKEVIRQLSAKIYRNEENGHLDMGVYIMRNDSDAFGKEQELDRKR